MKYQLILILLGFCFSMQSQSGPTNDFEVYNCPDLVHCIYSSQSYSYFIPQTGTHVVNVENCSGTSWSQSNFKFEALSNEMEVIVIWEDQMGSNDDVKCGIIDVCGSSGSCVVDGGCQDDYEIVVFADDLIIGHTYIFYVDGCNSSDQFDVEIEFNPGPLADFTSISEGHLRPKSNCEIEFEPNTYCNNMTLIPEIFGPNEQEIEYLYNHENAVWIGTIDSDVGVAYNFEATNLSELEFQFNIPGHYYFFMSQVQLNCETFDIPVAYEFEIIDVNNSYGTYTVCEHDFDNWIPDNDWLGPEISEPGYYVYEYENECGCPFFQEILVVEYEEVFAEETLVLCPDDYPYEYFDGYILEYEQDDYALMLRFDGESVVEDSYGQDCDSLIHLTVINENPEDRCSSCDLPLSLEKSKIVYCIPFDNGSFDVSGKANPVYPFGVSYDNNGPASNVLWEAEFDGRDDHVRLPHMDDLNTSVFAVDLQFNKDKRFREGDVETLLSKGDLSNDNLRYTIELHKVTEEIFDLVALFYTESEEYEMRLANLERNTWYGITYVIEEDRIDFYLDGMLESTLTKSGTLKGNKEDVYISAKINNGQIEQAFGGRIDNFKYWKQKLSGQDVLFLYFPEKEFEVELSFFLRCCETAEYEGIEINSGNVLDSIVVEEASPTGYDSVFILNYIEIIEGPQVVDGAIPEDVLVERLVSCGEDCSQWVSWDVEPSSLFADLCGIQQISNNVSSPVLLSSEAPVQEVVYTATNACGHTQSVSFMLELMCEETDFDALPSQHDIRIDDTALCSAQRYCTNNPVVIDFYVLENGSELYVNPDDYESLLLNYSIDGISIQKQITQISDWQVGWVPDTEGTYVLCYESLESECEFLSVDKCVQLEVEGLQLEDYGSVRLCESGLLTDLPEGISETLRAEIAEEMGGGSYVIESTDECGCTTEERIDIDMVVEEPAIVEMSVCEDDFPIELMGRLYENDRVYDGVIERFAAASEQLDDKGMACDSVIVLSIEVIEADETMLEAKLCEGDSYNGYTESGVYVEEYVNVRGCDSIVHLNINVEETFLTAYFEEICEGETFLGYGEAGTYEELYTAENGCDSTVVINLTVLEETHPDCFTSSTEDIHQKFRVYPNPTKAQLIIEVEALDRLDVYNSQGERLLIERKAKTLDFSPYTPGVYFVVAQAADGRVLFIERVVRL